MNAQPMLVDTSDADFSTQDYEESYQRVLPELLGLLEKDVATINLGSRDTVARLLAAWSGVRGLRDELRDAPGFNPDWLFKLKDYTLALGYTHYKVLTLQEDSDHRPRLLAEGRLARRRLKADIESLCVHGLVDRSVLKNYRGSKTCLCVAEDLNILVAILRTHWAIAGRRVATTESDMAHACKLATDLMGCANHSARRERAQSPWVEMRRRAFTLALKAYGQIRKAAVWVRWDQGDADAIVPSLYRKAKGSRRKGVQGKKGLRG